MNPVRHTHRRQIEMDVDIWTSYNTWFVGPISIFIFYCLQTRSHVLGDTDFNWICVINYVFITLHAWSYASAEYWIHFRAERSLKAKFHYASCFEAGSKLVGDQLRTSFEPASVMEFGFYGVHAFGYDSAESEPIWMKSRTRWVRCLGYWPWQILGAIRAVARAGEPGEIFCQVNNARLYRFRVGQISRNMNTTRRSVSRWILSEQNVENSP